MAGIGFELKKLFQRKGLMATLRAYGYAGMICAGPMLLGMLLLLGVVMLANRLGMEREEQNILVCMITYAMLISLTLTSPFSMPVTRFIADTLYEGREGRVFPSLIGACVLQLALGDVVMLVFLMLCGLPALDCVLMLLLVGELVVTWNQMSYLTAVKDYQGLMLNFVAAVATALFTAWLLPRAGMPLVEAMLLAVMLGYGLMLLLNFRILRLAFPKSEGGMFDFLAWLEDYKLLAGVGLFMHLGLFAHIVLMWFGPVGEQVRGLFYGAPMYDIPSLAAFITILVTTVNFVVSVEVNFYPRYRNYYALYNSDGNVVDIEQTEQEMLGVMWTELTYTFVKQLIVSMLAIAVEDIVLDLLPLGFNDLMHGYFRTLCVGYGLYACGNVCVLILLYFTDYRGACAVTLAFALSSAGLTLLSMRMKTVFFGIGFLVAAAIFFGLALLRLRLFVRSLPYYILSQQDVTMAARYGMLRRLRDRLNRWVEVNEG